MGVEGWYPFANEHGIHGKKLDPEQTQKLNVEVDLLGLYYWLIINLLHKGDLARLQPTPAPPPGTVPAQPPVRIYATSQGYSKVKPPVATVDDLAQEIHHLIANLAPGSTTIHIDGARTLEKQAEHQERDKTRDSSLDSCFDVVVSNFLAAQQNQRQKKVKWFWKKITTCRPILDQDKARLIQQLGALGWQVCPCRGEADVCIAHKLVTNPTHYAASQDSDMFFHMPVKNILKPFGRSSFLSYSRADVLESLKLNEAQMQLLAIVSNSDFAQNIPQKGLQRNLTFIQTLDRKWNLDRMLQEYKTRVGSMNTTHSKSIFVDRTETLIQGDGSAAHQRYLNIIRLMQGAEQISQRQRTRPQSWIVVDSRYPPSVPATHTQGPDGQRYMLHNIALHQSTS